VDLPNFSNPPRAVAIDLDGTLLDSQTLLSERNRKAVEACIDKGIPVVIVTQRAARTVRRILGDEFCEKCSLVLLGGAFASATPPLSGYIRETIVSSLVKDITEVILSIEPEVRIIAETGDYLFGTNKQLDPDELWRIHAATPEMQLPLELVLAEGIVKIAVDGQNRDLSSIIGTVRQQFANSVLVIPANSNTFLNITNTDASKSKALKRLLDSIEISMDDLVAIGDDIPDLELLTACGIPIAVANAVPEIKAVAKYQTASNDEDGVAIVLEKILQI